MSDSPQVMQMVIVDSPEVIEAKRIQALQKERLCEMAMALKAAESDGQGDENAEGRHENDYSFVVNVRGSDWLATWESSCRTSLMMGRSHLKDGTIMTVNDTALIVEQDDENGRLAHSYTLINLNSLFEQTPQAVGAFMVRLLAREDSDVDYLLDKIMQVGSYNTEWPDPQATSGALNIPDLFILLHRVKTAGGMMINRQNGLVGTVENVYFREASATRPACVGWGIRGTVATGGSVMRVVTNYQQFDGKLFGVDLPMFPATAEQIAAAVTKGKELHEVLTGDGEFAHLQYDGVAYTPGFFGMKIPHAVKSRVVADPEGLRQLDQHSMERLIGLMGVDPIRNDDYEMETVAVTDLEDADFAGLIPQSIMYNLNKSAWMLGEVSSMSQIKFRENAFDQLVLDAHRKRMVNALVVHSNAPRSGSPDLIDGKGGGCIFLLDGPPGTGKTLTAEATADKLQRVLYKVGLSELGIEADSLEDNLSRVLDTAARWGAVLLLDEADVFLEKRSSEHLERNVMVAVFLRLLEYYNGIMFLTTNRGDNFDPAALSRVTLAMHFVAPDALGRATIWTNLLKNAGLELSQAEITQLAQLEINGREIKNAINSSHSLAAEDGTAVTYQHIREITDASAIFLQELRKYK